jgi:hypothetical protein
MPAGTSSGQLAGNSGRLASHLRGSFRWPTTPRPIPARPISAGDHPADARRSDEDGAQPHGSRICSMARPRSASPHHSTMRSPEIRTKVEGSEGEDPVRGRHPGERSLVRPTVRHARGNEIALGDDVLHGGFEIGEAGTCRPQPLLEAVAARRLARHRIVVDEIPGKQRVQCSLVAGASSGDDPTVKILVALRHAVSVLPDRWRTLPANVPVTFRRAPRWRVRYVQPDRSERITCLTRSSSSC